MFFRTFPVPTRVVSSLLLVLAFAGSQALAADSFDLTFTGDGSFSAAHKEQTVHVAVVDVHSNSVVAEQSALITGFDAPAFVFQFPDVLKADKLYDIRYWIDSNFGEGKGQKDACDPVNIDHQWRIALNAVTEDISKTVPHAPVDQAPVCATFE